MGLARPEDVPAVKAAAADFLKRCVEHGLKLEQIIQASICVASSAISMEAHHDLLYAMDLVKRHGRTLQSAVAALVEGESSRESSDS